VLNGPHKCSALLGTLELSRRQIHAAVGVQYLRLGLVVDPVAGLPEPPVQVDVVELGELALVEAADEQERVALDEQGRAGCAADSPGPIELADVVGAEANVIGCAQG
jgi:hypothetical protein